MTLLKIATLSFAIFLCSGCAVFERSNRPLLNWFESSVIPENNIARNLTYPLTVPGGVVALALDMTIIHPACSTKYALKDTDEALWTDLDWGEQYVTECTLLPFRAAFTPVVFTGDLLLRSMFDIGDGYTEEPDEEETKRQEEEIQKATREKLTLIEVLRKEKKYNLALKEIDALIKMFEKSSYLGRTFDLIQNTLTIKAEILFESDNFSEFFRFLQSDEQLFSNTTLAEIIAIRLGKTDFTETIKILIIIEELAKTLSSSIPDETLKIFLDGVTPLLTSKDKVIGYQALRTNIALLCCQDTTSSGYLPITDPKLRAVTEFLMKIIQISTNPLVNRNHGYNRISIK